MTDADWIKHGVIYHILIDRFAGFPSTHHWNQPNFLGGNIRGIIEKLPYLLDLGVTTLWISPFYQTSAYHGYHITDFYRVDPHFGTLDDLKELIQESHARDLRIIADFVPNHCSVHHPFFQQAQKDEDSDYRDWFYFTTQQDRYLSFLSVKEIPKLNLDNPPTRDHLVNAAKYWLSLGLDGFRLDHVIGPSHRFWKHFRREIKDRYPHALLLGEAWMMGVKRGELRTLHVRKKFLKWLSGATSETLFQEYIGELDGVLDFKVQEHLRRYVTDPRFPEEMLDRFLEKHYRRFPDEYVLPTFLDNHDMDRFLFICGNDTEKLKTAASKQFSLPQPAIIYYGTEIGMTQTTSLWTIPSNGDLQVRSPMDWEHQDKDLYMFYKTLIKKKKNEK